MNGDTWFRIPVVATPGHWAVASLESSKGIWQWGEEETEPKDASASVTIQCPARERALGYTGAEDGVGAVKAKGEDLGLLLDTTLCFPPRSLHVASQRL